MSLVGLPGFMLVLTVFIHADIELFLTLATKVIFAALESTLYRLADKGSERKCPVLVLRYWMKIRSSYAEDDSMNFVEQACSCDKGPRVAWRLDGSTLQ